MGLIKAFSGAFRSELADQWKEYFVCDSMSQETLLQLGRKRINTTNYQSSNTKGSEHIITQDSLLVVNEGQAMIVTEQGKIIDFTCEAGAYTFDSKSEPSMLNGNFSEGLRESFRKVGKRFTFGGDTGNDQRVYYINTKEILGNKYGTAQPMAYDDPYYKTVLYIRYYGMFTFKITDPLMFYNSIAGNVSDTYNSVQLLEQCRSEFLTALDTSVNKLSRQGVKFSEIPSHQMELSDFMSNILDSSWKNGRGMEIISVGIEKITPDDKSRARIEDFDTAVMLGNTQGAIQGRMTAAQSAMFENMGKQSGGVNGSDITGAVVGMMGMNMMNNMMPNEKNSNLDKKQTEIPMSDYKIPDESWMCKCGTKNQGKFCIECGSKRPFYKCSNCGWESSELSRLPKFCPECGFPFGEKTSAKND